MNADLFGAKLGNWLSQPAAELAAFGTDHARMIAVGVPLMLIAGLATFFPMPIGVLLYFLATNVWTLGQQHFLTKVVDREEEARKVAKPKVAGPRPGQKPRRG